MVVNFNTIIDDNRLLYEYIRGSHLYGLNTNDSDIDKGGIYIQSMSEVLGLRERYVQQVKSEKNDDVWYELDRFIELLNKSNPNILEALFVPDELIITKPHPCLMPLFENKEKFLTKKCFQSFISYANSQIEKCRGLNKKIVNPVNERLSAFDFIYTVKGQGSTKLRNWLDNNGLEDRFCGLVNLPNMHDIYGLYYDWGAHFLKHCITVNELKNCMEQTLLNLFMKEKSPRDIVAKNAKFIYNFYRIGQKGFPSINDWYNEHLQGSGYRGIMLEDSNELRSSSVVKGEIPICHISYNRSGYSAHCKMFKEYMDWVKNRNPVRYESNLNKNYDSKNVMHSIRLMHMGKEIAEGKGMILKRDWDRQFLLDVRNHKYEYDEIIGILEKERGAMNKAMEESKLPDKIDMDFLNDISIKIKEKFYNL